MDQLAIAISNLTDRIRVLEGQSNAGQSYTSMLSNGGFEKWSLGPGPFTADGATSADNWILSIGAGSTMSVSRDGTNEDTIASTFCAAITYNHVLTSYLRQSVVGVGVGKTPVSISIRIKTSFPNAVLLECAGVQSKAHSGSGSYETLTLVVTPNVSPFRVRVQLFASCVAYVDSAMAVQGAHPIDYVYQDQFLP